MGFLNRLFGLPPVHSAHGKMADHMMELVHWFMLLLFVGWTIFLTLAVIKFRKGANPRANYLGVTSHASSHIEIGVIIAEVILLLGFAFPLWAARVDQFPDPDVKVNAVAEQFKWSFHYAGADGKFGLTNRFLITTENSVGLDMRDPNAHDDFVSSELVIPVDKKIEIAVTSKDVIHNLALKSMRNATDADPGKINRIWFKATATGPAEIVCGQLCGAGHGNMKGMMDVKKFDAYEKWAKGQTRVAETDWGAKKLKTLGITAKLPAEPVAAPGAPAPAATPVTPAPAAPAPAPAAEPAKLDLGTIPNVMKFDKTELTVKPGQKVILTFKNEKDVLQHNFLLLKPGTKEVVGALADQMLADPQALAKAYIPASPDILAKSTKLIGLGQSEVIEFTAPAEAGDYPYICTFPGHWRLMNGVLKVVP